MALANGFRDEMRDKILSGTAHITIMRADGQPIGNYNEVITRARQVHGVIGAAPTTYDGAVITGPNSSTYAVIRGIDSASAPMRQEVQRTLISGSVDSMFEPALNEHNEPQLPNVVIGAELARQTGLKLDDIAEIIPASASVTRRAPVRRNVHIAGIFRSGLFEYDSTWIYLAFDRAAIFAGSERAASLISVEVQNIDDVDSVSSNLRQVLGENYSTVDWKQANVRLFSALELERRAGMVVIALIILIAALNITTTLVLVVIERRSDIAVLRTMGARAGSILAIFLTEGVLIGSAGAFIGIVLGWFACLAGNRYKLVRLPADVYSIGNVPFNSKVSDVAVAALVAIVLSLVATLYPAYAAARMKPVEILRDRN
jgi:lipoprotein-releasing system permease protein